MEMCKYCGKHYDPRKEDFSFCSRKCQKAFQKMIDTARPVYGKVIRNLGLLRNGTKKEKSDFCKRIKAEYGIEINIPYEVKNKGAMFKLKHKDILPNRIFFTGKMSRTVYGTAGYEYIDKNTMKEPDIQPNIKEEPRPPSEYEKFRVCDAYDPVFQISSELFQKPDKNKQ